MSTANFTNPVVRWVDHRLPIFSFLHHEAHEYPTPKNLSYWWNFGSLAGIMLVIMLVTGITLAMHYTPHVDYAFNSVERIMRDVNSGWLIRYIHMNGASFFFIAVYIHIFRGLYYGSYKAPRELLWMLGVVIMLLMMATAFMGYVLPWGQMSFWGCDRYHQPVLGDPDCRRAYRYLAVGRLLGCQPDAEPVLRAALSAAVRDLRGRRAAHHRAAPFRFEQPAGYRREGPARHDPVPSLLHDQGCVRSLRLPDPVRLLRLLRAELHGPSGQLHSGQPDGHAGAYRA